MLTMLKLYFMGRTEPFEGQGRPAASGARQRWARTGKMLVIK